MNQLFRFPGMKLAVDDGNTTPSAQDHLMLTISNANYFGGSFHIAPHASLDDGKIDAVSILNCGPLTRARLFSKVGKGKHEAEAKVRIQQSAHFRVEHQTEDGEARRDDENFSFVSAWEWIDESTPQGLHKEDLAFEYVQPSQRSYK